MVGFLSLPLEKEISLSAFCSTTQFKYFFKQNDGSFKKVRNKEKYSENYFPN